MYHSSCCLSGQVHEGKPAGRVETIGGIQTYVSEPKDKSNAKTIIFIVDSKGRHSSLVLAILDADADSKFLAGNSRMSVY